MKLRDAMQAAESAMADDDAALDDEFPEHTSWSVYVSNTRRAVAANRTAALYAALTLVRDRATTIRELTIIGPRDVDGVNVGVRYPVFASALVAGASAIQTDYGLMRLRAAVDDLKALATDVDRAVRQATDAAHAIDVLRGVDGASDSSYALTCWLATETANLFDDRVFSVRTPRSFALVTVK